MKADIFDIQGKKKGSTELPQVFSEAYRPDVIKKAFIAFTSANYQAKGSDPYAGQKNTAEYWNTGAGQSRMPKTKAGPHRAGRKAKGNRYRSKGRWFPAAGRYSIVPGTVGGREAHPPKSQENILRKVNSRELELAIASAIAATASQQMVKARGHAIDSKIALPIVIDDQIETIKKSKEAVAVLKAIGLDADLERCAEPKERAGQGKWRGRRFRRKKGPLIVIAEEKGIELAARNIGGVDITTVDDLNIEMLAPGATAGRLTIWTKGAIEQLAQEKK